jgi:hypothetical protein
VVSLKDLSAPAEADIPHLAGAPSIAVLHDRWRRWAVAAMKKGKRLLIVIEEAHLLLSAGESFWAMLTSLRYYQGQGVAILISAQPALLAAGSIHVARLLRGQVLYPRRMNPSDMAAYISAVSPGRERQITCQAYGHWGTVKYLVQLLQENAWEGQRLTVAQIEKWARERGDMRYFAQIMWAGLSPRQQQVVRQFVMGHGHVSTNEVVRELIACGLLYRGGRQLHWFVPWTLPFVREYLKTLPPQDVGDWQNLTRWGKKEARILTCLYAQLGRCVSYDTLWDAVAPEEEFSLWALSRMVARIRAKLAERGYGYSIVAVRGVGYRLE